MRWTLQLPSYCLERVSRLQCREQGCMQRLMNSLSWGDTAESPGTLKQLKFTGLNRGESWTERAHSGEKKRKLNRERAFWRFAVFLCKESAKTKALSRHWHFNWIMILACRWLGKEPPKGLEGEITRAHTILGLVCLSIGKNMKPYNSWNPGRVLRRVFP